MQETIRGYPSQESKRRLRLIVILSSVGAFLMLWAICTAPVIPIMLRGRESRLEFPTFKGMAISCSALSMVLQFILPTILGAILASPMRMHRLSEFCPGTNLAPLWRRCLAKAVDAAIIFGPGVVGTLMVMASFEPEMSRISDFPKAGIIAWVISEIWALLWIIVCIKSEAKTGRTIGKALLGIKVLNEKMQPCGIGAALTRNLLGFFDAAFFGVVGICFAALSVRWQRLGDLTARTIVVQEKAN